MQVTCRCFSSPRTVEKLTNTFPNVNRPIKVSKFKSIKFLLGNHVFAFFLDTNFIICLQFIESLTKGKVSNIPEDLASSGITARIVIQD